MSVAFVVVFAFNVSACDKEPADALKISVSQRSSLDVAQSAHPSLGPIKEYGRWLQHLEAYLLDKMKAIASFI